MSQKANNGLKSLSIKALINSPILYSKVLTLLEQKKSYDYIINYLSTKGFKMSKGSLTNLTRKIDEANQEGKPIKDLADKRVKNGIDDVPDEKISGFTGKDTVSGKVEPIYSEEQVLEKIISKGVKTIDESDFIDPKTLMKAIDLHAKYYGNKTRGLTSEGLKQYQLIMQAESTALRQVFFQYIPKDKQAEALQAMEDETNKILTQIGVTKEGKELLKQLRKADLPLK